MPVYDEKYIKVKVKEFNGVVNTGFSNNIVPKEGTHHVSIASISIDSVIKIEKLFSSVFRRVQVYDEEEKDA